jgi:acetyl esterase/lipase
VRALVAVVLLCACSDSGSPDGAMDASDAPDSGRAGDAPPGPDGGGGPWESIETTLDDGEILVERVRYRSGSLVIDGQVCRPNRSGALPVVVWNHGGWFGLGDEWNGGICADTARLLGWVVVESSYRGEDSSTGDVELCLGEVDDVLALLEIALDQPWADPDRVAMVGASHGGCITLRALERGAPVHVAAVLAPPGDFAALHAHLTAAVAAGGDSLQGQVLDLLEDVTGGTPAEVPDAYRIRSPLAFAADLEGFTGPLLILSGGMDTVVPPAQQCALAAATPSPLGFHVIDESGTVAPTEPSGCPASGVAWQPGPRPTTWPDQRYLFLYDPLAHDLGLLTGMEELAGRDLFNFVSARL